MSIWTDECHQFSILRTPLRQDLVSWFGFSNSDAGKILNWFNPANPEYLEHVDEWQRLLCGGAIPDCSFELPGVIHHNAFGSYDLFSAEPLQVYAVHQVAKLLYKYHGTPRRETNMSEVKTRLSKPLPVTLDRWEIESIRECLRGIRSPDLNVCTGRFGPGATSEGYGSYEKWSRKGVIPDVPPNLFRANPRDPFVPTRGDGFTRIAEVPKSIKSNRIVSSEPAMYMFSQLAVNDAIVRDMHHAFRGHVFLADQERHNEALYWDEACCIDLKDASDHNSVELVQAVLPDLWPVLATVRSTQTLFPDGDIIDLSTFAPMGSGVCFSVMTLVILGLCEHLARQIKRETGRRPWYHVYGDDIICARAMYDALVDLLSRAGFLVNRDKSCCTGVYRESCGTEMFRELDITPAYIRDPIDRLCADKVEQVAGLLDRRFFQATARVVAETADCARFTRYNRNLQRLEVNVRAPSVRQKLRSLDGWSGLNRWFCTHTQGNTWNERGPSGVVQEVWTRPSWRFKSSEDYPYLTHWLVTSAARKRSANASSPAR